MIKPYNNIEDRTDKICESCTTGIYKDTYVTDALEGKVQCTVCHEVVFRYAVKPKHGGLEEV